MAKSFENWLIASDIDGTLNNKFRKLPKKNYDAIKAFTENGGHFTLASGRPVSSLKRNYDRVTPNAPAVVLNGAGIYDYAQDKMLWRSTIGETAQEFVRTVMKEYSEVFKSLDVGIFFDDYVYIVRSGILGRGQMFFDKTRHEVTDIDSVPSEGWMKVIFWGVPAVINSLRRLIDNSGEIKNEANFMASSLWSMEMLAKGTHKGVGVMQLADMLGIEKSHVAAIGDYYNDWDMLKTVGLPACAGQAPKPIHNICKYEACHCNHGCVADLIGYITSGRAEEELIKK